MISLILCCRITGNVNSDLINVLNNINKKAHNINNFEILIKFDNDDEEAKLLLDKLPKNTKYIFGDRLRGYEDLHVFYEQLYAISNKSHELIWAITDDFDVFEDNWDAKMLKSYKKYNGKTVILRLGKLIRLHRMTYPPKKIDSWPVWTRKWLECAGFGPFLLVDVWTAILEYLLFRDHNIDNRILVKPFNYQRRWNEATDGKKSERAIKIYSEIHKTIESDGFKAYADQITQRLADQIEKEGKVQINSFYRVRQAIGRLFMK